VGSAVTWITEARGRGEGAFRIGRAGDDLIAEFVGIGVLRASRSGARSVFEPAAGADPVDVAKLRAGIVPALLRHLEQKLTLHGAATAFDGIAIACIGESGAGKSTIAARLCDAGGALVSDDTTAIELTDEGIAVVPTEVVHWLIPDAEGTLKEPVAPRARAFGPVPIRALCRLRFDDGETTAVARRLRGVSAAQAIVPAVIRFVLDELAPRVAEFDQIARLLSAVPVYDVARPRTPASLGETVSRVLDLAARTRAERYA
jgi:hypothetical protein